VETKADREDDRCNTQTPDEARAADMNETQTISDKKSLERAKVLELEIQEQKVKLTALESKLKS
jgi:hypothetical protein